MEGLVGEGTETTGRISRSHTTTRALGFTLQNHLLNRCLSERATIFGLRDLASPFSLSATR